MDVAAPERQQPVVDLDRGRDGDDEGRGREEEAEIGVHARYVHVVRPDEEAERADDDDRPDHHPVAEDVLAGVDADEIGRSEEHTSELQSLMRISYAVFCLKKKKKNNTQHRQQVLRPQHNYNTIHISTLNKT